MRELCEAADFGHYDDQIYQSQFENGLTPASINYRHEYPIDIQFETCTMYNDFLYRHTFYLGFDPETDLEKLYSINYSGGYICPICGNSYEAESSYGNVEEDSFKDPSDLICCCCSHDIVCESCGEHFDPRREPSYLVDGYTVCSYCYDELPVSELTGERHLSRNMSNVYIMAEDNERVVSSRALSVDIKELEALNIPAIAKRIWYKHNNTFLCHGHWLVKVNHLPEPLKTEFQKLIDNPKENFYHVTEDLAESFFDTDTWELSS